jgi:GNAT superfamily N-acetyltransferase
MRLRPARLDEAPALTELALRSKGHWGHDAAFLERCRPELTVAADDVEAGRVTVAVVAGAVAGFATVRPEEPAELEALFVEPAAMGHGVGRALLREAQRRAGTALLIESDPQAEAFYLRHGAERIGRRTSPSTGRELPLLRLPYE